MFLEAREEATNYESLETIIFKVIVHLEYKQMNQLNQSTIVYSSCTLFIFYLSYLKDDISI